MREEKVKNHSQVSNLDSRRDAASGGLRQMKWINLEHIKFKVPVKLLDEEI